MIRHIQIARTHVVCLVFILLSFLLCAGPVQAQPKTRQANIDLVTLESFTDGVVAAYMRKDKLPGVTLAIVKDGEIVLLKGYGIAGVDPERKSALPMTV